MTCINIIVGKERPPSMFTLTPMRAAVFALRVEFIRGLRQTSRKAREERSAVSKAQSRPR